MTDKKLIFIKRFADYLFYSEYEFERKLGLKHNENTRCMIRDIKTTCTGYMSAFQYQLGRNFCNTSFFHESNFEWKIYDNLTPSNIRFTECEMLRDFCYGRYMTNYGYAGRFIYETCLKFAFELLTRLYDYVVMMVDERKDYVYIFSSIYPLDFEKTYKDVFSNDNEFCLADYYNTCQMYNHFERE
jgi:hypothetical protein